MNIIAGIDKADAGELFTGGERMADMTEKRLTQYRRRHLGYVFQMYNLIPNLTVQENIEVGAYLAEAPLNEEGIQELTSKAGDDLKILLARLRAAQALESGYQTFSGLAEGQTGSVEFIIETAAIEAE